MQHVVFIPFLFALGSCVGSFLNVVIWRLPRGESLVTPPSHCPKCNNPLKWYDNIPVIGWLKLGGKCRFCKEPISPRYPIVEAITGAIFVFYYVMFYMAQVGPCAPMPVTVALTPLKIVPAPLSFVQHWPIFLLYMFMVSGLLAASLIDAELFIVPIEIPWVIGAVGLVVHTIIDKPSVAGALNVLHEPGALAAGGAVGLILSITLWWFQIIPTSFGGEDEPMQDLTAADRAAMATRMGMTQEEANVEQEQPEYTRRQLITEMRKEMIFLLPPMLLAAAWWFVTTRNPAVHDWWASLFRHNWFSGMLGSIFGALVGAFVVWITRILGTIAFGRLAMGLGDVHLMFGVGAVVGAGAATVAFFIAPFFGIVIAIIMLLTGKRREIPYVPYLALGTAAVLLFYCPIAAWLRPGMSGLGLMVRELMGIS